MASGGYTREVDNSSRRSSGFDESQRMRPVLFLMLAIAGLSACGDVDRSSDEQWLEQYSPSADEWDRVGRIFGFYDDREGCATIVKALAATPPRAQYRCVPVN